jgi:transposase
LAIFLNNKEEPDYQGFKTILTEAFHEIDSKVIQKIKGVIKKYNGELDKSLRYIICLNEERKRVAQRKREEYIVKLSKELEGLFSKGNEKRETIETEKALNKIFEGHRAKFRKFFDIQRGKDTQKALGFKLNQQEISREKKFDGIFTLLTNRKDLEVTKALDSYKNLKEVEILFDDLKNFVDIRPVRHWLVERVCAHVFVCILSLLLKRIFEVSYLKGKAVMTPLEEISKVKLVKYKVKFSEKYKKDFLYFMLTLILY